jgi:hypothetical protein
MVSGISRCLGGIHGDAGQLPSHVPACGAIGVPFRRQGHGHREKSTVISLDMTWTGETSDDLYEIAVAIRELIAPLLASDWVQTIDEDLNAGEEWCAIDQMAGDAADPNLPITDKMIRLFQNAHDLVKTTCDPSDLTVQSDLFRLSAFIKQMKEKTP